MIVLSHQHLRDVIRGTTPFITGEEPIEDKDIQMASLDLTLGTHVYGMRASALPRMGQRVGDLIKQLTKYGFELSRTESKLLHRGQTYIVPLNERVALPQGFEAKFSPKSSIGRVDVFVRVLADGVPRFDHVPEGYKGPLYLEITPLSWDILVRARLPMVQMRIRTQGPILTGRDLAVRHSKDALVWGKDGKPIPPKQMNPADAGIFMHVDLDRDVVGFAARDPALGEIDLSLSGVYEPEAFWEPIARPQGGSITICPGRFYLLATKERVKVPPDLCGDIAPYDASAGEFRSHYAGFFDPGFGGSKPEDTGTDGVMEVRGREFNFQLGDHQPICRMEFEQVDAIPERLYGEGSSYTGSAASLSKHFERRREVWSE